MQELNQEKQLREQVSDYAKKLQVEKMLLKSANQMLSLHKDQKNKKKAMEEIELSNQKMQTLASDLIDFVQHYCQVVAKIVDTQPNAEAVRLQGLVASQQQHIQMLESQVRGKPEMRPPPMRSSTMTSLPRQVSKDAELNNWVLQTRITALEQSLSEQRLQTDTATKNVNILKSKLVAHGFGETDFDNTKILADWQAKHNKLESEQQETLKKMEAITAENEALKKQFNDLTSTFAQARGGLSEWEQHREITLRKLNDCEGANRNFRLRVDQLNETIEFLRQQMLQNGVSPTQFDTMRYLADTQTKCKHLEGSVSQLLSERDQLRFALNDQSESKKRWIHDLQVKLANVEQTMQTTRKKDEAHKQTLVMRIRELEAQLHSAMQGSDEALLAELENLRLRNQELEMQVSQSAIVPPDAGEVVSSGSREAAPLAARGMVEADATRDTVTIMSNLPNPAQTQELQQRILELEKAQSQIQALTQERDNLKISLQYIQSQVTGRASPTVDNKVAEYRQQLDKAQIEIRALSLKEQEARDLVAEAERNLAILRSSNETLNTRFERQTKESQALVQTLQESVESLKVSLEQEQTKSQELEKTRNQVQQDLLASEKRSLERQERIQVLEQEKTLIDKSTAVLKVQCDNLGQELRKAQLANADLDYKLDHVLAELQEREHQLTQQSEEMESLNHFLQVARSQIGNQEEQQSVLQEKEAAFQKEMSHKSEEIQQLQDRLKEKSTENQQLQDQLKEKSEEIQQLQIQLSLVSEKLESEKASLHDQTRSLASSSVELQQQIQELQSRVKTEQEKCLTLEQQLKEISDNQALLLTEKSELLEQLSQKELAFNQALSDHESLLQKKSDEHQSQLQRTVEDHQSQLQKTVEEHDSKTAQILSASEQEKKELQEKLVAEKEDVKRLESLLAEKKQEIERQAAVIEERQKEIEKQAAVIEEKTNEINQTTKEYKELLRDEAVATEEKAIKDAEMVQKLQESRSQVQQLEQQLSTSHSQVQQLEQQLSASHSQMAQLEKDLNDSKDQLKQHQLVQASLEKQLAEVEKEQQAAKSMFAKHDSKLSVFEDELKDTKAQKSLLEEQNSHLQQKLQQLEPEHVQLETRVTELQAQVDALGFKKQETEQELEKQLLDRKVLEDQINQYRETLEQVQTLKSEIQILKEQSQKQIESLTEEHQRQLDSFKVQNQSCIDALTVQNKIDSLTADHRKQIDSMTEEHRKQIDTLKEQLSEKTIQIQELESKIAHLQQTVQQPTQSSESNTSSDQLKEAQLENNSLKEANTNLQRLVTSLQSLLKQQNEEMQELKENLAILEKTVEDTANGKWW